jgi:hypothetical protein
MRAEGTQALFSVDEDLDSDPEPFEDSDDFFSPDDDLVVSFLDDDLESVA